ncbi:cell envelope integrity TolA C-terminal domain-containing protein [Erwinia sp. BNK-24-b]|uniref:cell envelope integrity TolA C-terminal domain-containing protein n=1 Tax=unclassified Erwinia TaxID=2622719 RepID=UPI0039BF5CF6
MSSAKIKTGALALLTLLLAACQSRTEPPLVAATPQEMQQWAQKNCSQSKDEHCAYFAQMQYGIQRNFYDAHRYHGRECAVTISWGQNGRYNVQSTAGDEQLCLKTWGVISSAKNLPPPPENLPATMVLDFKPD